MRFPKSYDGWCRMWGLISAHLITYGPPWSTIWNRSDW